nr:hypothetical protein [Rhodospirillales bacterium]
MKKRIPMEKGHFFISKFIQNKKWNRPIRKFSSLAWFPGALILSHLIPSPLIAHAFGQRYDLPLPLWLFIAGGALAVMVSFIIIALFARPPRENDASLKFNLLKSRIGKFLVHPIIIGLIRFVFTALFILIIAAGFWGSQNPLNNISIVMVWVIAWVGLAFICSLLGNFWAIINPWNTIFLYIENGYRKITGNNLSRHNKYPIKYGYLPSFVFFFCFAWLEINWSGSNTPSSVATALLVYSLFTFVGMWVYGRETWQKYGECFTVVYSLFSRFSITEGRINSEKREWFLRPPGIGLLREDKNLPEPTLVYFILLLLSTVTYDGFTETETFQQISLSYIEFAKDLTGKEIDAFAQSFFDTVALLSFPIVFILTYGFFIWLSAFMDEETKRTLELARVFIFSIVPISIAYHLSHYISLLAIEGQLAIRLISDPFGFGWNLFNTSAYQTDITIINAKFVWYFSIILIVIGHIIAVYVAHMEALRIYADRSQGRYGTLISQIPMIVLIIGYTMLSLWIIAQPIVG